jgi:hypothetical protein
MAAIPRRVYLSASCRNQLPTPPRDADPAATISDTRGSVILPEQRLYELAFERASITDASNLPLFEPVIAQGAANVSGSPNECVYSVSATIAVTAAAAPVYPFTVTTGVNDELVVTLRDAYGAVVAGGTAVIAPGAMANAAALQAAIQLAVQAVAGFSAVTCPLADSGRLRWTPTATTAIAVSFTQGGASLACGGAFTSQVVGQAVLSPAAIGLLTVHQATFTGQSKLWWVPEDAGAPVPPAPTGATQQAFGASYYAAFNLATVAQMFTAAWAWAFDDSASPFNATPGTPTSACIMQQYTAWAAGLGLSVALTTRPPECIWNAGTGRFQVAFDRYSAGIVGVPASSVAYVWPQPEEVASYGMNQSAFYVLQGLPQVYLATGDAALTLTQGEVGAYAGGQPAIVLSQQMASTGALSPVTSIALVSTSMGTDSQVLCPPTIFSSTGDPAAASASDSSLSVLTDLSVGGDAAIANGSITYLPQVLRFVGMGATTAPLKSFSCAAYWRHARSGALIPVRLAPGGEFSVLVVFKRLDVPA